jgi:phospholipid-translocating ATPase
MFDGLYQSAVCFFLPYFLFWKGGFVTDSGLSLNSTSEIGVFVACGTITVVNLYILLNQQHWDWLFLLIVSLSVLSVWFWTGIYSLFQASPTFYETAAHVFGTLPFWAVTFLMIIICMLPRFAAKTIQKFYFPYDSDIIREQIRLHMFDEEEVVKSNGNDIQPSPVPSPPKLKGFLSSTSSRSAVSRKSRSPSPAKVEQNYANDDERPIYPPSVTQSPTNGRPASQADTDISSDIASQSRTHHRRSTDHTERWHSHTSPMIPEIVEVR